MKEIKVYIDELPKTCNECPCCDSFSFCHLLNKHCLKTCNTQILCDCPLINIKVHNQELVKEVCEKIKLKFSDTRSHNWGIEQFELYEFLDQIQKEYDK